MIFPNPGNRQVPTHFFSQQERRLRRGIGWADVLVVIAVIGIVVMMIAMTLPRQRESARAATCRAHLMQIGFALGQYHQGDQALPIVPRPVALDAVSPHPHPYAAPLGVLMDTLGIPDLSGLTPPEPQDADSKSAKAAGPRRRTGERPVASPDFDTWASPRRLEGFLCPSDPNARTADFLAPTNYRANASSGLMSENALILKPITGLDQGPFHPLQVFTIPMIKDADGLGFTAAFAERLLGDGRDENPGQENYAVAPGPLTRSSVLGDAPPASDSASAYRGNAGWNWALSGWHTSLYAHDIPPQNARSRIAPDGQSALIGPSSAHHNAVHVLLLDGQVRAVSPDIDPKIWRALGTIRDVNP